MSSVVKRLPEKFAGEKLVLTFDFTAELDTGETLTGTPTVSVITSRGTDASPTTMLNGAAAFDTASKKVLQPIQGGLAKCEYTFGCLCSTTNAQKKLERAGVVPVI